MSAARQVANLTLAALLPFGVLASQSPAPLSAPAIAPLVRTEWLQGELARPDLVILQLGSAEEFRKAHIPGALAVDLARDLVAPPVEGGLRTELPSVEALTRLLRANGITETSRVVIVFDQANAFTRAGRAFYTLEWAGLGGRVAVLDGGLPKWQREGRQVSAGAGHRPRATRIALHPEPSRRATRDEVQQMIGRAGMHIVDARDTAFFQDLRDNQMPRGGHIASAVSLPYSAVTNADGTLRSPAELASIVRGAGIGDDDALVSYCHVGIQASWMYFALRVLGRDVRMFDGSFDEWSRDAALPVEGARARPE